MKDIGASSKGTNTFEGGVLLKSYTCWYDMLKRCYFKGVRTLNIDTYEGCSVSDEWLDYTNFKEFYDSNYREGYHLDKDLIIKDNKVYSKETCCFLPKTLNTALVNKHKKKSPHPVGVNLLTKSGKYQTLLRMYGEKVYLGQYDTKEEASQVYIRAKQEHIKSLAEDMYAQGLIDSKVYKALLMYKV